MGKVILICGLICSGKSTYARRLIAGKKAVLLSCDELTKALPEFPGAGFDRVTDAVRGYLTDRAAELARLGVDVVLDWGFWQESYRQEISNRLRREGVPFEWHYIDVSDETHRARVAARNAHPGPSDYFVDGGLLQKCLSLFEKPARRDIDVWVDAEA